MYVTELGFVLILAAKNVLLMASMSCNFLECLQRDIRNRCQVLHRVLCVGCRVYYNLRYSAVIKLDSGDVNNSVHCAKGIADQQFGFFFMRII